MATLANYNEIFQPYNDYLDSQGVESQVGYQPIDISTINTTTAVGGMPTLQDMQTLNTLSQMDANDATARLADMQYNTLADYNNSFVGQAMPYISGFNKIAGGLGSLASIAMGFKQLSNMDRQIDMAKEQWTETKNELARVRESRKKATDKFLGRA